MLRLLLILCLGLTASVHAQGCDSRIELMNAPPRATWIQAEAMSDGIVDLTLWVYDVEQEPVDVHLTWSLEGVEQGALELAPGGHGTQGLVTRDELPSTNGRPNPDGRAHLIRWALPAEVDALARVQVHVQVDDLESEPAPRVSSPAPGFVLNEGSGQVVALETL